MSEFGIGGAWDEDELPGTRRGRDPREGREPRERREPRESRGRRELREQRDGRGWRRLVVAVLVVLGLLVAGLTLANAVRGPRLVDAQVDPSATVERAGSRLVLRADQTLRPVEADDVRVTPAAPLEVTADGSQLTLRFTGLLAYATEYRIRVAGVSGAATGASGDLEYSFRTPAASVYSLVRQAGEADDSIVRRTLGAAEGEGSTTVFAAPHIRSYAVLPDGFAAVTVDAGGSALRVGALGDTAGTVTTPAGSIAQLRSSGSTGLLGFVMTTDLGVDPAVDHVLYSYDPADAGAVVQPVLGLDGAPLSVLDWTFVPGSTSIVAQAFDQSLYLVDPVTQAPPTPLGAHAELRGFVPGTTTLVVADPTGGSILDLATGTVRPLSLAPDGQPAEAYVGRVLLTSDPTRDGTADYAEVLGVQGVDGAPTDYRVVVVGADGPRVLWHPAAPGTRVRELCVSPNGQYLAVETVPASARVDDDLVEPGFPGAATVVVDLATGASNLGTPGFAVDWCG